MNTPITPTDGVLTRCVAAWNAFWFTPQDPTLLGMMRILVGTITLYTFAIHSITLQEFVGEHAWFDREMRREMIEDRPMFVGALLSSPLYGGESVAAPPADERQAKWADDYKNNWGMWPPSPHPETQHQAELAHKFRAENGYDFRFYGLPFPKDNRERRVLDSYVKKYHQAFPPPYPADEAEEKQIDDYMVRHQMDPRRLYGRGIPVFSIWMDVVDPAWMNLVQTIFTLAAICFIFGLGTRVTSVIVWFADICYIQRNPAMLFGVDTMMNVLLLYLMIGPSGAALSLDRLISRWWSGAKSRFFPGSPPAHYSPTPEPRISANLALRMMQIHLCIIYFISGVSKLQGVSWWNGTAVWNVLGNFEFAPMHLPIYVAALRFLGHNQLLFDTFITSAGMFTLAFEISYPFMIWKPRFRWIFLAGAIFLHGFIGLFMGLKTFSLIMLVFNMAFLRPDGWFQSKPPEKKLVDEKKTGDSQTNAEVKKAAESSARARSDAITR